MAKLHRFLKEEEKIVFEIIKNQRSRGSGPGRGGPYGILFSLILLGISFFVIGIILHWIFFILAAIFLIIAPFLFKRALKLDKKEERSEKYYIITNTRVIEKSSRVFKDNTPITQNSIFKMEDIIAFNLSKLDRFEIEKRNYLYNIFFFLEKDSTNKAWIIFKQLKKYEKEDVIETLMELESFTYTNTRDVEIFNRS